MRHNRNLLSLAGLVLLTVCLNWILPRRGLYAMAQQDSTCSIGRPCALGCCSKDGKCGYTDAHCKDGCISNCNATAECGQYAKLQDHDCPINVCCSKHGFCGTGDDFCGDGCQENSEGRGCGGVSRKTCPINSDALTYKRRIAYYELFTKDRDCGKKEPATLPLGPLTHINLAFVNFNDKFDLDDNDGDWISRIVARKIKYNNLRVNIAIGGWVFNDPPTATYWSDMASTKENRAHFISSCVKFLRKYGLDGVDLDWEYPTAADRGGSKHDAENYVSLVREMRAEFDGEDSSWEISATFPTSLWYLKGFDVKGMEEYLSYINLMSYDIHGMWDHDNEWTGPYLRGHTDWREIDEGLDLLWRNDIDPKNVVMGFGFYGRSFTMKDPSCHQPNGICEFTTGGDAGDCSNEAGVLTYQEVASRNNTLDVGTFYDPKTTVKYNVYEGNQWVSYDDAESFEDKKKHLSERCLSGLMIWAIDQDTAQWDAMGGIFGDYGGTELEGLNRDSAEKLHDMFGQFNGQDCFVTERCTDDTEDEKGDQQVCPSGFVSVEKAHAPYQKNGHDLIGKCEKGWFRHICCPKKSVPKNCKWDDGCHQAGAGCGDGKFKLNEDPFRDAEGNDVCSRGSRNLCCDGMDLISDCIWTECDGEPRNPNEHPDCPSGYDYVEHRLNNRDGSRWCSDAYTWENEHGSDLYDRFTSSLCCPTGRSFKNCRWSNDADSESGDSFDPDAYCKPQSCSADKIKVADALDPPASTKLIGTRGTSCDGVEMPAGYDAHFPLCCSPPDEYNEHWPVDPQRLWKEYWNDPKDSSVAWKYANNHDNNDEDKDQNDPEEENGDDAYGFLMLDGPKGAIDDGFAKTQTFVRRSKEVPKVKREILTSNETIIGSVFDHSEEILHVYCNYPTGSAECEEVFIGGAVDTIISLPDHIGEGPFARIVSMEKAAPWFQLPTHHLEHRLEKRLLGQPVYEVKIDYNFHLIEAREDSKPVNIRVDYTNLLGYWDELTNSSPSRIKRGLDNDHLTTHEFRSRVQRGVRRDDEAKKKRRRRREEPIKTTTPMGSTDLMPDESDYTDSVDAVSSSQVTKRWWGKFTKWLDELTSVREGEKGVLPLEWYDKINLFKARWGCPGQTFSANLRMDLEAEVSMDATYAYYLSARFVPPQKPEAFLYFGVNPNAYLGLVLKGNARMQTGTGRKKIIDTLAYPGLAVKGIAAVGPTLDVYGEIQGHVTIKGEAKAGARLNFGRAEVYWPQDDATVEKYDKILDLGLTEQVPSKGLEPTFEAGVEVDAQLNVIVTPEANVGIKIGGSSLTAGRSLVDAQVTGWMQGILSFQAHGDLDLKTMLFNYRYGVYIFYNVGFKAKAVVLEWVNWATKNRAAYREPLPRITIHEESGSINLSGSGSSSRRSITDMVDNATMSVDPAREAEDALWRRADDDGSQGAKFTQNLQCPKGIESGPVLPALRLNCGAFPQRHFPNYHAPSHCENSGYLQTAIMAGQELTLTHDPNKARVQERRSEQCTSAKSCNGLQAQAQALSNVNTLKLECDEFPQGASEEGGDFHWARSTLCVPSYQNNMHGQCVKLLSGFQTNVGSMETSVEDPDDRVDGWADWRDDFWSKEDAMKGSAKQRFSDYDEIMPIPAGFDKLDGRGTGINTWMFKRNYTFSVTDGGNSAYSWWDSSAAGPEFVRGNAPTFAYPGSLWDNVICAVNIFGQDDYYQEPRSNNKPYNALCLQGPARTVKGWPDSFSYANCHVEFEGTTASKRSWTIRNITYHDEVFVLDDVPDLTDEISSDMPDVIDEVSSDIHPVAEARPDIDVDR